MGTTLTASDGLVASGGVHNKGFVKIVGTNNEGFVASVGTDKEGSISMVCPEIKEPLKVLSCILYANDGKDGSGALLGGAVKDGSYPQI